MSRTFDELVAEADAVSVAGGTFLDGRALIEARKWEHQ
jgi:hypothetical protein